MIMCMSSMKDLINLIMEFLTQLKLKRIKLAQLELELQRNWNNSSSSNTNSNVKYKAENPNFKILIQSIHNLSIPIPTKPENYDLFFIGIRKSFSH